MKYAQPANMLITSAMPTQYPPTQMGRETDLKRLAL